MFKKVFVVLVVALAITGFLIAQTLTSGTTIAEALAKKASERAFEAQATRVGLNCDIMFPDNICKRMISRAEKNPQLQDAFLHTQSQGVYVYPEVWPWFSAGSVGAGRVGINILASDQRIIEFLEK